MLIGSSLLPFFARLPFQSILDIGQMCVWGSIGVIDIMIIDVMPLGLAD